MPSDFKTHFTQLIIKLSSGSVKGTVNDDVYAFKGIPYAQPLVGLNRWLPPLPRSYSAGILDATKYGYAVPQLHTNPHKWLIGEAGYEYMNMMRVGEQGDDSLNLNVWTSSLFTGEKLPVMVWLHGGGLAVGAGSLPLTDGEAFARKGIVLVSLNYRLGCMGLMAGNGLFKGEVCIGNRAFMDQEAALKWVQENIHHFGGDASNVTLFGQSAGGSCVGALMVAPSAKGLFHRAIIQSGPFDMMPLNDHLKLTRDILEDMNIKQGDEAALAAVSNDKITGTRMQRMLFKWGVPYGKMSTTKLPFAGAYDTQFLPQNVLDAIEQGAAKEIDLMIGSNKHDGRLPSIILPAPKWLMTRLFNFMIRGMIGKSKQERKMLEKKYQKLMPDASNLKIQEQIQTDALYRMRSISAAEKQSMQPDKGNTFMYDFNWESPAFDGELGAIHGLEIPFVFNNLEKVKKLVGDLKNAQPLADVMNEAWVSFARTGIPSCKNLPEWKPYNIHERATMIFDNECRLINDPDGERRKIWEEQK